MEGDKMIKEFAKKLDFKIAKLADRSNDEDWKEEMEADARSYYESLVPDETEPDETEEEE